MHDEAKLVTAVVNKQRSCEENERKSIQAYGVLWRVLKRRVDGLEASWERREQRVKFSFKQ